MLGYGYAIPLTNTLAKGGGLPSWVPRSETGVRALFHADYANDLFWLAGSTYADETAHNVAWGATKTGLVRQTAAPLVTGAELVANGTFDSDVSGWGIVNGATITWVAGRAMITGNGGNTPGLSRSIAPATGRAYRASATGERVYGSPSVGFHIGPNANLGGSVLVVGVSTADGPVDVSGYFGAGGAYVGARLNAIAANGTGYVDNLSVREVVPFAGWAEQATAGVTVVVAGTTPAAASGDKVVYQADDGGTRNRLRIVWGADKALRAISTVNAVDVCTVTLGTVEVSTAFRLAVSLAANVFRAALGGGAAGSVTGQATPGLCYMRIGRSYTGETWDGGIDTVTVWPAVQSAAMVETLSGPAVAAWGDSLTAQGYPALAAAAFSPPRAVYNGGVGGETSTQILARMAAANRSLTERVSWLWAGRNDLYSAIDTVANVAAMAALVTGGRYLVGSILPWTTDSPAGVDQRTAINTALAAAYGARYVDIYAALVAANDGSPEDLSDIAAGWTPRSLRADSGHLNTAGYTVAANTWVAATVAMGW